MVFPERDQSRLKIYYTFHGPTKAVLPPYELSSHKITVWNKSWYPENRLKGWARRMRAGYLREGYEVYLGTAPLPFPPLSLHANTPSPHMCTGQGAECWCTVHMVLAVVHCTHGTDSCTLYTRYWQLYTAHMVLTVVHCIHGTDSCTLYTWYWHLYTVHMVLTGVLCTMYTAHITENYRVY